MKLYRSLPRVSEKDITKVSLGFNNEATNLLKEGKVTPSLEYLRGDKNPNKICNTFGSYDLAKYFYPSFYDALTWSLSQTIRYELKNIKLNFLIWEIDIPDFLVEQNIGVGNYNNKNEHKLEVKIPYYQLASLLGLDLSFESIMAIKEFFQKYYSWLQAPDAAKEGLITSLENNGLKNIDEAIYAALCFKIFMPYQVLASPDANWLNQVYDVVLHHGIKCHQKIKELTYNYDHWATVGHGDINNYLYKEAQAMNEDNESLKRILKQEGFSFKRR